MNTWSKSMKTSHEKQKMTPNRFKSKLWSLALNFLTQITDSSQTDRKTLKPKTCVVTSNGYTNGPLIKSPEPKNFIKTIQLPKVCFL